MNIGYFEHEKWEPCQKLEDWNLHVWQLEMELGCLHWIITTREAFRHMWT